MLTREEALFAADVAEKYPAGTPPEVWGYNNTFMSPVLWGDPHEVARHLREHPQSRRYG